MRVVRLTHDVVLANFIQAGDAVGVVDETAEDGAAERMPYVQDVKIGIGSALVVHEPYASLHPVALLVKYLFGSLQMVGCHAIVAFRERNIKVNRSNMPLKIHESIVPEVSHGAPRPGWR